MYFDQEDKQYQQSQIINPPFYTKIEIDTLIGLLPPKTKTVTEFGAGTGRLTIPLLRRKLKVTAVDISQKSLNKLVSLAKQNNLTKINTSIEIVKSKNIVGCDVLHHVDINKYFKIFYDKLDSGGLLVFSEPNGWNIFWYLLIWMKLDWREEKGIVDITKKNVTKELRKAGFKRVEINGLGLIPGLICLNNKTLLKVNNWLGNLPLLKFLAYRLIIVARKN